MALRTALVFNNSYVGGLQVPWIHSNSGCRQGWKMLVNDSENSMSRSTEMKGENDIFYGISFWNKKELLAYISALMTKKSLTPSDIDGKNAGYVEKGTWHQIQSGKNPPNPKTARRLVFALHCTIDEADEFLSLCGMRFVDGNEIDTCLKTCIQNEIYKWSEVQNNIHKVLSESATKSNSF